MSTIKRLCSFIWLCLSSMLILIDCRLSVRCETPLGTASQARPRSEVLSEEAHESPVESERMEQKKQTSLTDHSLKKVILFCVLELIYDY